MCLKFAGTCERPAGKGGAMSMNAATPEPRVPSGPARRKVAGAAFSRSPRALLAAMGAAAAVLGAAGAASQPVPALPGEPLVRVGSLSVVGPVARPNPALSLPLAPAAMMLPLARPDLEHRFPRTPETLAEDFTAMTGAAPEASPKRFKLRSGEGMAQLLVRGGIDPDSAQSAIPRIASHLSMRSLPVGFEVEILPAGAGHGAGLRLPLEDEMTLAMAHDGVGWQQRLSLRPADRYLFYADGTIDSSLYKAAIGAGIPEDVLGTFVSVLGFSVDFQREIRKGDRFEVLYQKSVDLLTGKAKNQHEVSYISMVLSGKRVEFFRHAHLDGESAWYDPEAQSAARGLMRTPVNGARLSSGYGNRKHPILGYSKMHRGIDFAAPTGTPILAAGSGVVEAAGRNGAYGKYVRIRHSDTYQTAYAHMSSIAVKRGARVTQGQVIGKVGSTGRSTGPHLHYEILVNNRHVNPLTVRLPSGKKMPDEERPRFERTIDGVNDELGARGIIRFAGE